MCVSANVSLGEETEDHAHTTGQDAYDGNHDNTTITIQQKNRLSDRTTTKNNNIIGGGG